MVLGSHQCGIGPSDTPGNAGNVRIVRVGHREEHAQAYTDDAKGPLAAINLEHNLSTQFDIRLILEQESINDHGIFVPRQQPSSLNNRRARHDLGTSAGCKQVDRLTLASIWAHPACW